MEKLTAILISLLYSDETVNLLRDISTHVYIWFKVDLHHDIIGSNVPRGYSSGCLPFFLITHMQYESDSLHTTCCRLEGVPACFEVIFTNLPLHFVSNIIEFWKNKNRQEIIMSDEIPVKTFYGTSKGSVRILDSIQNPNNSDLDEIELVENDYSDDDFDVSFGVPHRPTEIEEDVSESSEDSEYDLPLSEIANRYRVSSVSATDAIQEPLVWYSGKDNAHKGKAPIFRGQHLINVTGDTPYAFFSKLFPEEILDLTTKETIRYAIQSGKHSFNVSVSEMKHFSAINIIMTYIKYPAYIFKRIE
ncbi:uncharacterized protein [Leptinotarsa decemlineata]|uniref:uncharacterized protein n=1 Tax=Leptinotarsa decemlineata TaxID=7539 RepID=UPI003D30479C